MRRPDQRGRSGVPGVIARNVLAMRETGSEFGHKPDSAHNLAKCEGPPPLALAPMLGLTRRRRQANPDRERYNFSLSLPILPFFQAFEAIRSEEHTSELQSHSDLVCR